MTDTAAEPLKIVLDGPVPTEPGWYVFDLGGMRQLVKVFRSGAGLVFTPNAGFSARHHSVDIADSRWSRRLEIL